MSRAIEEDLKDLRDLLNDFASDNTDVATASEVLSALYENQSFLSELLTKHYNDTAVFHALVKQDNAPLLTYLYEIQPDILTVSLELTDDPEKSPDTIVSIAFTGKNPQILAWLEEQKSPYFLEYKERLDTIKNKTLNYIQQRKLKKLINLCENGDCDEIDNLFNSMYAAKIVAAADTQGHDYLSCLAKTSPTILRVQLGDQSVFNLLCAHPELYADALTSIREYDWYRLMPYEQQKLQEIIVEPRLIALRNQAICYICENSLDKLNLWGDGQSTQDNEDFFASPYAQDVFKVALAQTQDPGYVACLVETNISALRVTINGTSIFDILCGNPLFYKKSLQTINTEYLDDLTEEEHEKLKHPLYQHRALFHIQPSQPILNDELFLAVLTGKTNGKIHLTADEQSLLSTYIDPNLWPDNVALDAYLHSFFEPLAKKGLILTPTMTSTTPIDLTYLANLASGAPLACITGITIDNGTILPQQELKDPNTDMVAYALIPIAIDNHYTLLALELSATTDGIYRPGPRNYYIEPYTSHVPLADTKERLATLLAPLLAHKDFSLTTIRLNQQPETSVCCYYLIAAVCRAIIEGEDFTKHIANNTLDHSMIRVICLNMVTTLGLEYFKLQLPTYLKHIPESDLNKKFEQLEGIMAKILLAESKIPEKRKFNFPEINSESYRPKRSPTSTLANLSMFAVNDRLEFTDTHQAPPQLAAETDDASSQIHVISGNFNA